MNLDRYINFYWFPHCHLQLLSISIFFQFLIFFIYSSLFLGLRVASFLLLRDLDLGKNYSVSLDLYYACPFLKRHITLYWLRKQEIISFFVFFMKFFCSSKLYQFCSFLEPLLPLKFRFAIVPLGIRFWVITFYYCHEKFNFESLFCGFHDVSINGETVNLFDFSCKVAVKLFMEIIIVREVFYLSSSFKVIHVFKLFW